MEPQTLQEKLAAIGKVTSAMNRKAAKANADAPPVAFLAAGNEEYLDFGVIPTGNLPVDEALAGGLPRGAVVMLAGAEGAGKTCLAFDCIAYNQKRDPQFVAMYCHLESRAFPLQTALAAGVDLARLLVINAQSNAEKSFDLLISYLWDWEKRQSRDLIDLVVIDSIAAAVPAAELDAAEEEGLEKATVGRQAAMMSKALRVIAGTGCLGKSCLLFINQLRTDIGAYGGGVVLPGGKASVYYPKVILHVRAPKSGYLKRGPSTKPEVYGHRVSGTIQKNNTGLGKPHATFEYEVHYGIGVDLINPLADAALRGGVIQETSKGRYQVTFQDELVKYHGRDSLIEALRQSEEFRHWVETQLQNVTERVTELGAPAASEPVEISDGPDLTGVVKAEAELVDWLSIRQEAAKSEM